MKIRGRGRNERGQALVIMVAALAALCVAVAVTIDGGNVFSQQRAVQNGTDAAALAGAVELGNRGSCAVNGCAGPTDAAIRAAIDSAAAANNITVSAAYYTDVCGTPLKPDGTAATSGGGTVNLSVAAQVGAGTIPANIGSSANCSTGVTGPAAGVLVHFGHRDVPALVAPVVGINSFAVDTQATAVSTYGTCGSQQGCGLLPIAFPRNITKCFTNGKIDPTNYGPYQLDTVYVIPLCTNSPGNVGWIDWTPHAGGVSSITQPDNSPISFPSWQFVAQTGKPSNNQSTLRALEGTLEKVVQFDHTCGGGSDPNSSYPAVVTAPNYGCNGTLDGGNGSNLWYRLPQMLGWIGCSPSLGWCQNPDGRGFSYEDAYFTGNSPECDTAKNCLVGKFVALPAGNDGTNGSPVQLIK